MKSLMIATIADVLGTKWHLQGLSLNTDEPPGETCSGNDEEYIESERMEAEQHYDEGRRLRLQGLYSSAQESYQECISRLESIEPDDASRLMLRSLRGLGDCLYEQERFSEALEPYFRAQFLNEMQSEVVSETHYLSNQIGRTWQAMEEWGRSEQAYRASLGQTIEYRGTHHIDTAIAHGNLASALQNQDRHGEALNHLQQSLEIRRAVYPVDHRMISDGLLKLGKAWRKVGSYDRAFRCLRDCQEMRLRKTESLFGEAHDLVSDVLFQLGCLEEQIGFSGRAVAEFRACLTIREGVHGAAHPSIASALIHLGHALHHVGEDTEAVQCLERCIEMRTTLFGDSDVLTASAHGSMAYVLEGMNRVEEALEHQVICTNIHQIQCPDTHPDLVEAKEEMVRLAWLVSERSGAR